MCGVPRSGKTTFWRRLADKGFTPSENSTSTGAAESHYLSAHMNTEMLFDLQLFSEDTDPNHEALTIYKQIVMAHKPQPSDSKPGSDGKDKPDSDGRDELDSNGKDERDSDGSQDKAGSDSKDKSDPSKSATANEEKSASDSGNKSTSDGKDKIFIAIDELFEELDKLLEGAENLPEIPNNIKKICHLQDTGGQKAFLQLLPTLSTGKALYLLFFKYKDFASVHETVQLNENPGREVLTGTVYEQIDVIKQSLICVSTASSKSSKNVAMLVGTHVDQVESKDVLTGVNETIYKEVQRFIESETLVPAEGGGKQEDLVLKVAVEPNNLCSNAPKDYTDAVMDIVDGRLKCLESEKLPASWYMFIIVLRRIQQAGYSVLRYNHCEHIAKELYIQLSSLEALLFQLQEVFGIVLYFHHVEGLEDVVICDPGFIYKSISKLIFKAYDDRMNAPLAQKLKNWGIFDYNELKNHCTFRNEESQLEMDKLLILLKHLGIIAPVQIRTEKDETEHYLIPCMLKDATTNDLYVQIQDNQACSIVPLRIYFDCGFAPMGGFCYLFTKLISNNKEWELPLPERWRTKENNIYWRNKVTCKVKGKYFVTLLSTDEYYEIHIIHHDSEPFKLGIHGSDICKHVWGAIHNILKDSPNKSLRNYYTACICTTHQETTEHVMKFKCKPHEFQISSPVKAKCKQTSTPVTIDDMLPSVMVWFKVCVLK